MVMMEVIPCSLVEAFTKKKKKIMLPLIYIWLMHVEKIIDLDSYIKSWSLYKFIILGSHTIL
jgi:hypothetical protein